MIAEDIVKWECPFCGKKYFDESDAEECVDDCIKEMYYQSPILLKTVSCTCEMCKKNYKGELKAERCEELHKKNQDKFWFEYLDQESRNNLNYAANHADQTKLPALMRCN